MATVPATEIRTTGTNMMQLAWVSVSGEREIEFRVKACSQVNVILAKYIKSYHLYYTLVIGLEDNTVTLLYKQGVEVC